METPRRASEKRLALEDGRILVPTDFSACADEAYDYALALAAAYGATVRLLHVMAVYEPELYGAVGDTPEAVRHRERLEEEARERLHVWARRPAKTGVDVETVTRRDLSVPRAILEEAASASAALIVLGTHGRGRLARYVLGGVARRVLQSAAVPVLTVREKPADAEAASPSAGGRAIRRVLVPTDFSESAGQALWVGCAMAARYDAAVDLLHVVEPIPFPASITLGARSLWDYVPDLRAAVEQELIKAAEAAGCPPGHLTRRLEEGRPARTIAEAAKTYGTDLIVLASHGRSGMERFFLGSVTERVARLARCPVLTVRTPQQAREEAQTREEQHAAAQDAAPHEQSPSRSPSQTDAL